jgi:hypothetical protein
MHLHLVLRLGVTGNIYLLPLCFFMAWIGTTLPLVFFFLYVELFKAKIHKQQSYIFVFNAIHPSVFLMTIKTYK